LEGDRANRFLAYIFSYMIDKYDVFWFDLFGTLVGRKKNKENYDRIISFCRSKNLDYKNIFYLWKTENKKLSELISDLVELNNNEKTILKNIEESLLEEISEINLKPYTKELLDLLQENWKKLFLISNLGRPYEKVLEKYNLGDYFDLVIFSYEVWFIKPQKEIYELAINKYKNKKVIFSGDTYKADILWPKLVWIEGIDIKDLVSYLLK